MADQPFDAQSIPQSIAPYEPWSGVSAAPDSYYITLHPGFDVVTLGWLDNDGGTDEPCIEYTGNLHILKCASAITPEQREHIRHCIGVVKVTQFGDAEWLRNPKVQWFPKRKYGGPAYMVFFTDKTYTVGEHLARIGHTFEGVWKMSGTRSYVPGKISAVSEAQLRDIFSDPQVLEEVETGSQWC